MSVPEYDVFIDGKLKKVELTSSKEGLFTGKIDGEIRSFKFDHHQEDSEKPFTLNVEGRDHRVELSGFDERRETIVKVDGVSFRAKVQTSDRRRSTESFEPFTVAATTHGDERKQELKGSVNAPMTGKVVSVKVEKGDQVRSGQVICVIEAMKMENEITAVKAGVVKEVCVSEGSPISEGEPLVVIE